MDQELTSKFTGNVSIFHDKILVRFFFCYTKNNLEIFPIFYLITDDGDNVIIFNNDDLRIFLDSQVTELFVSSTAYSKIMAEEDFMSNLYKNLMNLTIKVLDHVWLALRLHEIK